MCFTYSWSSCPGSERICLSLFSCAFPSLIHVVLLNITRSLEAARSALLQAEVRGTEGAGRSGAGRPSITATKGTGLSRGLCDPAPAMPGVRRMDGGTDRWTDTPAQAARAEAIHEKVDVRQVGGTWPRPRPRGYLRRRGGGRGAQTGGGGRGVGKRGRSRAAPRIVPPCPAVPGCLSRHPPPGAASAGTSCLCCVPCPGEWALPGGSGGGWRLCGRGVLPGLLRPSPSAAPAPGGREAAGRRGARAGFGAETVAGVPRASPAVAGWMREGVRRTLSRWNCH